MYVTIRHICWPIELRHDHVLVPFPNTVGRQTIHKNIRLKLLKMTRTCVWQHFHFLIPHGLRVLTLYRDYKTVLDNAKTKPIKHTSLCSCSIQGTFVFVRHQNSQLHFHFPHSSEDQIHLLLPGNTKEKQGDRMYFKFVKMQKLKMHKVGQLKQTWDDCDAASTVFC